MTDIPERIREHVNSALDTPYAFSSSEAEWVLYHFGIPLAEDEEGNSRWPAALWPHRFPIRLIAARFGIKINPSMPAAVEFYRAEDIMKYLKEEGKDEQLKGDGITTERDLVNAGYHRRSDEPVPVTRYTHQFPSTLGESDIVVSPIFQAGYPVTYFSQPLRRR